MEINSKTIGSLLIGFAIILIFILTFVKLDNDKKSEILCAGFHSNQLNMEECPVHTSNFSWMIILAYGIGFVILLIGIFLLYTQKFTKDESKREFKNIDMSKLSGEERKFYEILKSKGGSAYQLDLIKETDFSKVKTTRTLDHLEAKGIIERRRRGMTNIIILK